MNGNVTLEKKGPDMKNYRTYHVCSLFYNKRDRSTYILAIGGGNYGGRTVEMMNLNKEPLMWQEGKTMEFYTSQSAFKL